MKCPSCQAENREDSRFCHQCATPLPKDTQPPVAPTKTMLTPFEDLSRGMLFAGRYEVIEELGKGGMGKVYRVYDQKINEVVALKLIKPEIGFNEKAVERFKNELKIARKISHRNVCRLYDLGEYGLAHFITMEYVEGENLKEFIRRAGTLTTGKAVSIAKQVCEGLAEAHRLGVIHRDLKPQNVMIDRQGNVRIMDFGLARFMEAEGVTGSGVMLGTPEYMSPEQVDLKDVDERSDIYSLGIILYEMVTGKVPFEGETPLSIAIKHKSEKPQDLHELNPLVPESLTRLILKCMEKDRAVRYPSAEELLQGLTRIEKGLPSAIKEKSKIKGEPFGTKEITVKFTPQKLLIPALLLIIVVLGALMLFKKPTRDTRRNQPPFSGDSASDKAGPSRFREANPAPPPDTQPTDTLGKIGSVLSKFIPSGEQLDVQASQKFMDSIKGIIPEKGPYQEAYNKAAELFRQRKMQSETGNAEGARQTSKEAQGEMQKLLSLVSERQAAQKAKEMMTVAKTQAGQKGNLEKNLLFRLASYERSNADDAFAKNDYSGAKILYRLLERIFALCPQCGNDKGCVDTLQLFVTGLKKDVERMPAGSVDQWLNNYAREIEIQAAAFLEKRELENAGGAYIRAAFLYEKILEPASAAAK
jgi:serine/threonine protein kinase